MDSQTRPTHTAPAPAPAAQCPLCCDAVLDDTAVTCSCDYRHCKKCARSWVLAAPDNPRCPNCHKAWDREFMGPRLGQAWVNSEFVGATKKILLARARARHPDLQPRVTAFRLRHDLLKAKKDSAQRIKELSAEIAELVHRRERLKNLNQRRGFVAERVEQDLYVVPGNHVDLYKRQLVDVGEVEPEPQQPEPEQPEPQLEPEQPEPQPPQPRVLFACDVEECRGFVTSDGNKCGVCRRVHCCECHTPVDAAEGAPPHACDPGIRASVAVACADSKPCPKCCARIERVSGCPQMWCTNCHTFFDWRTGLEDTGPAHNPHYVDYLRRHPPAAAAAAADLGEDLGMGCGDALPPDLVRSVHRATAGVREVDWASVAMKYARRAAHAQTQMLPEFEDSDADRDGIKLSMRLLVGEIDDKHYATQEHARLKRLDKNRDMRNILRMFVLVTRDILQRSLRTPADVTSATLEAQFKELSATVVQRLETIRKNYTTSSQAFLNVFDFFK